MKAILIMALLASALCGYTITPGKLVDFSSLGENDKMFGYQWSLFNIPEGELPKKVIVEVTSTQTIGTYNGAFGTSTSEAPSYWYMSDTVNIEPVGTKLTIVWEIPDNISKIVQFKWGGELKVGFWWVNCQTFTIESITVTTDKSPSEGSDSQTETEPETQTEPIIETEEESEVGEPITEPESGSTPTEDTGSGEKISSDKLSSFARYSGISSLIESVTMDYSKKFTKIFKDGPIYTGDGTAYGSSTSGGNCLFPSKEYYKDMMYAALNNKQYNDDLGCGLCALVVSDSNPYKPIRIRVVDQCPECAHGSLDFSDKAFKALTNMSPSRVKITWALIPCDIDVEEYPALVQKGQKIGFQFKTGSSQWWGAVQIVNTRYPVANVEVFKDGAFSALEHKEYNYWMANSGFGGPGPYKFRVTQADGTVTTVSDVKMVIPGDDEGEEFATGNES